MCADVSNSTPLVRHIISYILGLIFISIALIGAGLFRIYRHFVGLYLSKKHGFKVKFVKGVDSVFCFDDEKTPYFNQLFHVFKGVADVEEIRHRIRKYWLQPRKPDGRWKHIKLRQELRFELGYYFWIPKPDFCLDDHVIEYDGSHIKTKDDYHKVLEQLGSSKTLEMRIFWQFVVVHLPNGIPDETNEPHFILFFNMHHGLGDGISAIRLNMQLFDETSYDPKLLQKRVLQTNFVDHLTHLTNVIVFGFYRFVQNMAVKPPLVSLGSGLTGRRVVSISLPIPLDKIKQVKSKTGTTTNDVLTCCVLSAFNMHLASENRTVHENVKFNIPISLNDMKKDVKLENKVSFLSIILNTAVTSPVECLKGTKKEMDKLKKAPELYIVHYVAKCVINSVPKFLTLPFVKRFFTTAVVSNVPTSFSGSLCGSKHRQSVALGTPNSLSGCGIIVGMLSDTETVNYAIKADEGVMKDQETLDRFIRFVVKSFDDLYETTVKV